MYRFMLTLLALSITLGVSAGTGHAAASSLRDGLAERFHLSRMEVQNPSDQGAVIKKGTVLRLQADGIPANALRTVQLNTKSPRFHVPDYARVEVGRDGRITAGPGAVSLTAGTRLVVLDQGERRPGASVHPHVGPRAAARRQGQPRLHRVRLRVRSRQPRSGRPRHDRGPDRPGAHPQFEWLRRRTKT